MKIKIAEHTGFCMGVRKAILHIVHEINHAKEPIYILGSLIHNPQTISILRSRGLLDATSLDDTVNKVVAIRTHGITRESLRFVKKNASRIINLTCPRVARVQAIVKKYSSKGYYTIIIGDANHAEVESVKSYAGNGVIVISSENEIETIPDASKYLVVAQTTFDENLFNRISELIQKRFENVLIFNTICDSTHKRQNDVIEAINQGIDTLVVVGGKNSANTKRLASIGLNAGIKTLHVETEDELTKNDFIHSHQILVTAGASTPGWIINNVLEKIYSIANSYRNPFVNFFITAFGIITRLNIIASVASFFITLLVEYILNISSHYKLPIASSIFIFSMYAINNYVLQDTLKITNPFKYNLYNNNRKIILFITIAVVFISFAAVIMLHDARSLIIFGICFASGLIYSTTPIQKIAKHFLPTQLYKLFQLRSIVANVGWIVVSIFLPLLYSFSIKNITIPLLNNYILFAIFASLLIYIRNSILEIIAYGGDLIIGNITVPILIGLQKTLFLLNLCMIVAATSVLFIAYTNPFFALFLINVIYYYFLVKRTSKLTYFISLRYEILNDINFLIFIVNAFVILYVL